MSTRIAFLVALALLAAPAAAGASTVSVVGGTSNAIDFDSTSESINNLTVAPAPGGPAGTYRVSEPNEPITPGTGCVAVTTHSADCTASDGDPAIRQMEVHLGNGNDVFVNDAQLSCLCYGESGDDDLTGGDVATGQNDRLDGGPGSDALYGRAGMDFLIGDTGNDELYGGDGDDDLQGDEGNDVHEGGAGQDRISYEHHAAGVEISLPEPGITATGQGSTGEDDSVVDVEGVEGSGFDDTIDGTSGENNLSGRGGVDLINAGAGFDLLQGGTEGDTLNGGPGPDFLSGGDGNDFLHGEAGDDNLAGDDDFGSFGSPGDDLLDGGADKDTVAYTFRSTNNTAVLTDGANSTGNGNDATSENDQITSSVEVLNGGSGNDTLTGNAAVNTINGNGGTDTIRGMAGNDILNGGNDADTVHGGADADSIDGSSMFGGDDAIDTLNGDAGNDNINGFGGPDLLDGGADSDLLQGGDGGDFIRGDGGSDTLKGELGADDMGGGAGTDTVTYSSSLSGVKASLAAGASATTGNGTSAGTENDTIQPDVENLTGSDLSDELTGGAGFNVVQGRSGNDTLDTADGAADTADCGPGTGDAADADEADTKIACETGGSTGDTSAPEPTVTQPSLTSAMPAVFSGTAGTADGDLPGITVRVYSGEGHTGTPLLTFEATANSSGTWSAGHVVPLSAGTYTVQASQADTSENVGFSEPVTFAVTNPDGSPGPATPVVPVVPGPTTSTGKSPVNTVAPKVEGAPRVGAILRANIGGWVNGVSKFVVAWRVCDADGRSNCAPTKDAASFEHEVAASEKGRTFLFGVTASNASGSTTRLSPVTGAAGGAPVMPDVDASPPLKLKAAKAALVKAGMCLDVDVSKCKDGTVPVDFRPDGVKREDVPSDLRRTIETGEVFKQKPKRKTEIGQGDVVKLTFYDHTKNEPSTCTALNSSEAKIQAAYVGKTFSKVRLALQKGNCEHGWTVVAKKREVSESTVTDLKVEYNTLGKRFIQLSLIDPNPVSYKPVPQVDTDKDGLWDQWETEGVDANEDGDIDLDLKAMGADPNHRDLFIEMDMMDNHPFDPEAAKDVIAAFGAGDIPNPDGKKGVTLHLDTGSDAVMNPKTGAKWGTKSKSNSVPHVDKLGVMVAKNYDWTEFQKIKDSNLDAARATVFRYVVNVHNHPEEGTTGQARDIPGGNKLFPGIEGPSDAVVGAKNPCKAPEHCLLTRTEQAANFMHEVGHLLGLGHGGRGTNGIPDIANRKSNYLSVMNYSWSFTGPKVGSGFKLDFSPFPGSDQTAEERKDRPGTVSPLDESQLNELPAFRAVGAAAGFGASIVCYDDKGKGKATTLATLNGGVDFNCKEAVQNVLVSSDLNADGSLGILRSRDDWMTLDFTGGAVGDFNMVLPEKSLTPTDEPSYQEAQEAAAIAHGDTKAPAIKVTGVAKVKRGKKAKLKVAATDDKQVVQLSIQIDGGVPKIVKGTAAKLSKSVTVPAGNHRVIFEAADAAGNRSKRKTIRVTTKK